MKHRNRAQSSSLFLLELILAILFFSLASAVCVQFFVKSHLLSRDARNLNYAVNECSGIAEIINASNGTADALNLIQQAYKNAKTESGNGSSICVYYNDRFAPCGPADSAYKLLTALTEEDGILTAYISMDQADLETPIYQLTVKHHLQRRPSHE